MSSDLSLMTSPSHPLGADPNIRFLLRSHCGLLSLSVDENDFLSFEHPKYVRNGVCLGARDRAVYRFAFFVNVFCRLCLLAS